MLSRLSICSHESISTHELVIRGTRLATFSESAMCSGSPMIGEPELTSAPASSSSFTIWTFDRRIAKSTGVGFWNSGGKRTRAP